MRTAKASNYEMMQPLRQNMNLLEVPNLGKVPEHYHSLFYHIRRQPFVKEFSMARTPKKLLLHIKLRDGEIFNAIVRARLKALFASTKHTIFPIGPKDNFVNIEIPRK